MAKDHALDPEDRRYGNRIETQKKTKEKLLIRELIKRGQREVEGRRAEFRPELIKSPRLKLSEAEYHSCEVMKKLTTGLSDRLPWRSPVAASGR
jgi:hypothetical protein